MQVRQKANTTKYEEYRPRVYIQVEFEDGTVELKAELFLPTDPISLYLLGAGKENEFEGLEQVTPATGFKKGGQDIPLLKRVKNAYLSAHHKAPRTDDIIFLNNVELWEVERAHTEYRSYMSLSQVRSQSPPLFLATLLHLMNFIFITQGGTVRAIFWLKRDQPKKYTDENRPLTSSKA